MNNSRDNISREVWLLLGASSAVGGELLRLLDDEADSRGCTVICQYRTVLEGEYKHLHVVPVRADLSDESETEQLMDVVDYYKEDITHIVHLAALPLEFMKAKQWNEERCRASMAVSVYSLARVAAVVLPVMGKRKSGCVFAMLSSVAEGQPPKFMEDYVISKYALKGLMKSLEAEYGEKGIAFLTLSPGMMETKFLKAIDPKIIAIDAAASPMGRHVTAAETAKAMRQMILGGD